MIRLRPRQVLQAGCRGSPPPIAVVGEVEEFLAGLLLERLTKHLNLLLSQPRQETVGYAVAHYLEEAPLGGGGDDILLALRGLEHVV